MTDHPPFTRDDSDLVIDRAVREMMSAEQRPGFRQRVLMRLEHPEPLFRTRRWLTAGAAVAAILALVIWTRSYDQRPADESRAAIATTPAEVETPSLPAPTAPAAKPEVDRAEKPAVSVQTSRVPDPVALSKNRRIVSAASLAAGDDAGEVVAEDALIPRRATTSTSEIGDIVIEPIRVGDIPIAPIPTGGK